MLLPAPLLAILASSLAAASSSPPSSSKPISRQVKNVLEQVDAGRGYCSPSGQIEDACCAYETLEDVNERIYPLLHELVDQPFFRYFKVDLFEDCPFWYENGLCMNRNCGIETVEDESNIPEKWRAQALSSVSSVHSSDPVSSCAPRSSDFCFLPDDASPTGQYVDLAVNPERFTGYAGESAQRVWSAIYRENCFGVAEHFASAGRGDSKEFVSQAPAAQGMLVGAGGSLGRGGAGLERAFEAGAEEGEVCLEKRVYYKLISGLHSSISMHICAEWMNQETGEWGPNLQCFIDRLSSHPDRLQNIYFNYAVLLRALARARPYLEQYDLAIGADQDADARARGMLDRVLGEADSCGETFEEGRFFEGPDAGILKEEFKAHFRNVSRIMDCVGCDKCRLWGKVQISGLGTALKILFALDEADLDPTKNPHLLQRSEIVALLNTFHRISESLQSIGTFRQLYLDSKPSPPPSAPSLAANTSSSSDERTGTWTWWEGCRAGAEKCWNRVVQALRPARGAGSEEL